MVLYKTISIFLSLSLALLALSSCSLLPGSRSNIGNGTPAVIITPAPTAASNERGTNYAYITSNQLWVVNNGAAPRQISHFDNSAAPDVYWHPPVWSANKQYLATIVSAQPASQGGGGCPGPQAGVNGALYVLN